ncbi:MAG: UDP-N-acetylmuramate--L-alanine ligase [Patescibacteria group bacterium]
MKSVYLVGIAGAGMSGLARYFHHHKYAVYGTDTQLGEKSKVLEKEIRATIAANHSGDNIPSHCELVIHTPAVDKSNPELQYAREHNIPVYSYPEYLGIISKQYTTIAVAGTNGKTTTTAMIATVLDELGLDPTVIVGGEMPRFGSNFRAGKGKYFVVEACEYKESFLHLSPDILVLTNVTPDHLDYFGSTEAYYEVFRSLIDRISKKGTLVANFSDTHLDTLFQRAHARGINIINYAPYTFNDWHLSIPGSYNVSNAAAALAGSIQLGLDAGKVQKIIEKDFQAPRRRFEYLGTTTTGAAIYDDYAHNPEAIELLIEGIRDRYDREKIVMVFQPHLYSRTQDFFDEFAQALKEVDTLYLLPIYGAREQSQDFNVSSEKLAQAIRDTGRDVEVFFCEDIPTCITRIEEAGYSKENILICTGAGEANKVGNALAQRE